MAISASEQPLVAMMESLSTRMQALDAALEKAQKDADEAWSEARKANRRLDALEGKWE